MVTTVPVAEFALAMMSKWGRQTVDAGTIILPDRESGKNRRPCVGHNVQIAGLMVAAR
jgi:hypothetical protein